MPHVSLATVLPAETLRLLRKLGEAAHRHGARLWLVGGAVRDALLERRVLDIDLTSEMPAAGLAPRLALDMGGSAASATAFGTVKLTVDGVRIDLATARSERYTQPGALPQVARGDMLQDLARRDFSINAMAVSLAPADFEELLDTEGGQRDVQLRVVRTLHDRSFQDDATRMLRAVRYTTRLGFHIDRRTQALLRRDLAYLDAISGTRLRRELERMLAEDAPVKALLEAHRLGVLGAISQPLGAPEVAGALRRAGRATLTPMAVLGSLVYPLSGDGVARIVERLSLTRQQSGVAEHAQRLASLGARISSTRQPSQTAALVGNAPTASIQAAAACTTDPAVRTALRRYLRAATRPVPLTGADLAALGVPQGPRMGALLDMLRDATLDGQVRSRSGAVAAIKKTLQEASA